MWGEICRNLPDRPWGPPRLLYIGYSVFSGGKAVGTWRWPPTTSSVEVKETVELYLYSPFLACCTVKFCTSSGVTSLLFMRDFRLPSASRWAALFWLVTQSVVVIAYRRFGTTYRFHLPGSSTSKKAKNTRIKGQGSWPWNMGPIGCPETSVRNYRYSLPNNPEQRRYQYFSCSYRHWNTLTFY